MSRSIRKVPSEELLLFMDSSPTANTPDSSDVSEFIRSMRFVRGSKRMPFYLIYEIYRMWSDKPVSQRILGRLLKQQFERRRDRYCVYYLMAKVPQRLPGRRY